MRCRISVSIPHYKFENKNNNKKKTFFRPTFLFPPIVIFTQQTNKHTSLYTVFQRISNITYNDDTMSEGYRKFYPSMIDNFHFFLLFAKMQPGKTIIKKKERSITEWEINKLSVLRVIQSINRCNLA